MLFAERALSAEALALRERLDAALQPHLDALGLTLREWGAALAKPVSGGSEAAEVARPAARKLPLSARGINAANRATRRQGGGAAGADSSQGAPADLSGAAEAGAEAELPAALAALECSWRELELKAPHLAAAGVQQVLDVAHAALRRGPAAHPSSSMDCGAPSAPTEALVSFCERRLLRRPELLRYATARVYDMQAQLRLAVAGVKRAEMSVAAYKELKKVVTVLGIILTTNAANSSPAGPSASQESVITIVSPSGRRRRPPNSSYEGGEADLPSSACEYVVLLRTLFGSGSTAATLERLAGDFPDPVALVAADAAAEAAHEKHDSQVQEHVSKGRKLPFGAEASSAYDADDSPPASPDSSAASAWAADAPGGGAAASSSLLQPPARQPSDVGPWRDGRSSVAAAAAARALGDAHGSAKKRKAPKDGLKRLRDDGRRSSPRSKKSKARTAFGEAKQGAAAASGKGSAGEARASRSAAKRPLSAAESAGGSSPSDRKKRSRAGVNATSALAASGKAAAAGVAAPAAMRPPPVARAASSAAARARAAAAAAPNRRGQAPASPLPLLPTTVLARATPQPAPTHSRTERSPSPVAARLDLAACGARPPPLVQETPVFGRHSARVAAHPAPPTPPGGNAARAPAHSRETPARASPRQRKLSLLALMD